ncbi:hypothetical protein [Micromonospora profundi]|uniref:hypothetical protein n=1 Tax=Micromonospora profundi TaxID=1420889 RepID=UPI0036577FF9
MDITGAEPVQAYLTATAEWLRADGCEVRTEDWGGVAVFPALVGTQIEPAASAWAQEGQRVKFAAVARPVTVDAGSGTASAYRGNPVLGFVYAAHLRSKLNAYFPAVRH